MSKITAIWEELYGDEPMPDEFQPVIKILTVWIDRKYKKKFKTLQKRIKSLEDKVKNEKSVSKKKKSKKHSKSKCLITDDEDDAPSSIIVDKPQGTVIVSVYNNGYLIHGNTFSCKSVIRELAIPPL